MAPDWARLVRHPKSSIVRLTRGWLLPRRVTDVPDRCIEVGQRSAACLVLPGHPGDQSSPALVDGTAG